MKKRWWHPLSACLFPRKRGTLEADLLLSTFAAERLGGMGAEELQEFDKVRLCVVVLG